MSGATRYARRWGARSASITSRARRPSRTSGSETLEADNFTVAEVCEVIITLARQRDEMSSFSLDIEAITELVAAEADKPKSKRRGMARVVLGAAAAAHDPSFTPSKPDVARALARYAVEHPERGGVERRVLTLSEHLVRLTYAGRRLRGQLRQQRSTPAPVDGPCQRLRL